MLVIVLLIPTAHLQCICGFSLSVPYAFSGIPIMFFANISSLQTASIHSRHQWMPPQFHQIWLAFHTAAFIAPVLPMGVVHAFMPKPISELLLFWQYVFFHRDLFLQISNCFDLCYLSMTYSSMIMVFFMVTVIHFLGLFCPCGRMFLHHHWFHSHFSVKLAIGIISSHPYMHQGNHHLHCCPTLNHILFQSISNDFLSCKHGILNALPYRKNTNDNSGHSHSMEQKENSGLSSICTATNVMILALIHAVAIAIKAVQKLQQQSQRQQY